jgi:hypothetical protein
MKEPAEKRRDHRDDEDEGDRRRQLPRLLVREDDEVDRPALHKLVEGVRRDHSDRPVGEIEHAGRAIREH